MAYLQLNAPEDYANRREGSSCQRYGQNEVMRVCHSRVN